MNSSTKGRKFAALVARAASLDVSVLASSHPYPVPSSEARSAARQMVGAVEVVGGGRVDRLAGLLEVLREADASAQPREDADLSRKTKRRASA